MVEVTQEGADIFSFQLFPEDFCLKIVRRLREYSAWHAPAAIDYSPGEAIASDPRRALSYGRLYEFPFLARAYKKLMPTTINPVARLCWHYPLDDLILEAGIVHYNSGGSFGLHYDTASRKHLRLLSIVCYLNDDFAGGKTRFPRQNAEISPRPGKAIIFPSGITHPHEGLPVVGGRKFILTIWYCQAKKPPARTPEPAARPA